MEIPVEPPVQPRAQFAYQRVVDEISRRVADGALKPGSRVPSVRRMAAQWGVSIPTILQAYRVLEAGRIIEARPKSGYFVLSADRYAASEPRASRPDATPAPVTTGDLIVRFLESVADSRLVPLASALPDPLLLPTARLARILGAVARRESVRTAMVSSPSGADELRIQIARRTLTTRAPVAMDDVIITAGCAEAVTLGLRALTRPGDTVAVESPAYFGTLQAIDVLGLRALPISTDPREGLDLDSLARALRTQSIAAVVVSPTVHNPLGCVMSEKTRTRLGALLDTHRLPAIEDDTYADLHTRGECPPSLRAFVRSAPVLTCGSFLKTLASAYRVGWIVPGDLRSDILRIKAATTVGTAMPTQLAIAELLRTGGYDHHLRKLRSALRVNVTRMSNELVIRMPMRTRISVPAGGFLLWIELPEHIDSLELFRRCLLRGVSIAPGPVFSPSGDLRNFVRLNAGLNWSASLASAMQVVAEEAQALDHTYERNQKETG